MFFERRQESIPGRKPGLDTDGFKRHSRCLSLCDKRLGMLHPPGISVLGKGLLHIISQIKSKVVRGYAGEYRKAHKVQPWVQVGLFLLHAGTYPAG